MRPIAACAEIVGVEHTRWSGHTGKHPAFPAQWFTAYVVLSPAIGFFCHRHRRDTSRRLDASVEASGPHDFAVRKLSALVFGAACVHRILSRVRDDLEPPLCGTGQGGYTGDLGLRKIRIFLQRGLD